MGAVVCNPPAGGLTTLSAFTVRDQNSTGNAATATPALNQVNLFICGDMAVIQMSAVVAPLANMVYVGWQIEEASGAGKALVLPPHAVPNHGRVVSAVPPATPVNESILTVGTPAVRQFYVKAFCDPNTNGVKEAGEDYYYDIAGNPIEVQVVVLRVDLDGDFNHDGNVDGSDPDDPEEHTVPGLLVPLNEDDDDINGDADKDELGPVVDGDGTGPQENENDLVKVHLELLPDAADSGLVIFAATHPANAGDIKVWESPTKGGTPVLDTTTTGSEWKKEWTLSTSFKFGDIPEDLYVEGFNASSGGQITLLLRYQNPVGTTICEDEILISVIVPELDVGETARPANRIGWNDPRTVATVSNKMVIWSTDYTANKTQYDLLKYPDIAGVFYKIRQAEGWNSGYPVEDHLVLNTNTYNPTHDADDTSWDFRVHYGPSASEREKFGPYELFAVSYEDYDDARGDLNTILGPLSDWAEAVYSRFLNGIWPAGSIWAPTDESGSVTFQADQPAENVPYADLTHKFGATLVVESPVVIDGRRYPQARVTAPVYYWDALEPVNDLFRTDSRVETVVKAFLKKIPYDKLHARYLTAPPSGPGRLVRWEFSMEDHHRLYWAEHPSISLTGGDDTILYGWFGLAIPPWTGDPLALGDVWVVGASGFVWGFCAGPDVI
jgi:hypothetical protein